MIECYGEWRLGTTGRAIILSESRITLITRITGIPTAPGFLSQDWAMGFLSLTVPLITSYSLV